MYFGLYFCVLFFKNLFLFVCGHVSAQRHWCMPVSFVAVFVNVTQDSQIEGAIVSAGGQRE